MMTYTDVRLAMRRSRTAPGRASKHLPNLELLAIEARMALDDRGRLPGLCGVRLSVARDGQLLVVGSLVPDALVPTLLEAVDRSRREAAPNREPAALAASRAILDPRCGPLTVRTGPYYVIGPEVIGPDVRGEIVRSDASPTGSLLSMNPGNWTPEAWGSLLEGQLGPWAMVLADDRVVSICHTPRLLTDEAAECGVWTDPAHRGRGYASAATATWADIVRPSGRVLFYSTDARNLSSRRAAARLRLRPIGWTWTLEKSNSVQRPRPRTVED
jgi:hypothetical protein